MSICWLFLPHEWTEWTTYRTVTEERQRRRCGMCGRVEDVLVRKLERLANK